jgi:hypothetical protein
LKLDRTRRLACLLGAVAAFVMFWLTSGACDWFSDAPFLMTSIGDVQTFPSPRFLTAHEAALALVAALFVWPAIGFVVASMRGLRSPFERIAAVVETGDKRVVPVLAATIAACGAAFVSFALIDKTNVLDDERAYLFQAKLFLTGHVVEPGVLAAFRNQMLITQPFHAAKYFPGNSALLAVGALLHAPRLVDPVVAALTALAVYSFVADAFGRRQAMLAAAFFALSPFVWCVDGTLLAFGPTAAMIAAMLAGVARATKTNSTLAAALAGIALGAALVTRPFDALVLGAPVFAWLAWSSFRKRIRLASLVLFVLGAVALAWIVPVYDHALTGSIFRTGYALESNPIRLGFTRSFNGPYEHTFANGIAGDATILLRLDTWLLGLPGGLVLVAIGVVRRAESFDWLLRAMLATFFAVFVIVPAPGTWDVGPTYGFVLVPILVACAARGVHRLSQSNAATPATQHSAVAAFVALGWITTTPLRLMRLEQLCAEIRAPWDALTESNATGPVVVPGIHARAAAGWGYGYPPEIQTRAGTVTLMQPWNRREYDDAMRSLGATTSETLRLDVEHFVATKTRRFTIAPFDPETTWPTSARQ